MEYSDINSGLGKNETNILSLPLIRWRLILGKFADKPLDKKAGGSLDILMHEKVIVRTGGNGDTSDRTFGGESSKSRDRSESEELGGKSDGHAGGRKKSGNYGNLPYNTAPEDKAEVSDSKPEGAILGKKEAGERSAGIGGETEESIPDRTKSSKKDGKRDGKSVSETTGGASPYEGGTETTPGEIDEVLSFIYDREYSFEEEHSITELTEYPDEVDRRGSKEGHATIYIPKWIDKVKRLFPKDTVVMMENDAVVNYGLYELLNNDEVIDNLEPSIETAKLLLTFKDILNPETYKKARAIVAEAVKELQKKISREINTVIYGVRNRFESNPMKISKNFDFKKTIRMNLKNYDPGKHRIIITRPYFCSRVHRKSDWHIIICVDQSGSMLDSVINTSILAAIFTSLNTVKVNLLLFDVEVVDVSEYLNNIVEVLMSVQLGGGTNINRALKYAASLIRNPEKTIVVVISDFYEGGSADNLIQTAIELKEMGVTLIGLTALDYECIPQYDRNITQRLSQWANMHIGAKTPKDLAEFIFGIIHGKKV